MSTDGAGSLNNETKKVTFIRWRRKIDVPSGYIGRTVVLQGEEIDLT
jgi:hypothetical protein